jgi:hypothetical protein
MLTQKGLIFINAWKQGNQSAVAAALKSDENTLASFNQMNAP